MYKIVMIVMVLLAPLDGISQILPEWTGTKSDFEDLQVNLLNRNRSDDRPGLELKGSPFLFNEFRQGDLYFANGTRMENMAIKFNCYTDEVCFLNKGAFYAFGQGTIDKFVIRSADTSSLTFRYVLHNKGKKHSFLQVLYEGNIILYKMHHKEYVPADYTSTYNADRRYNEYTDKPWYYIRMSDGALHKLRLNEKFMIRLFSDRMEEISRFIRSNNIRLSQEKELISLAAYYDQLSR